MSIRKKHIIHHYTIVEVMVAMGIFLVMMTIMMQFFTTAQQMWNISAKRNDMYADARVAMNLMTREIQCMLYRNEATDGTGIYPFWFEWTDIDLGLNASPPANMAEVRPQDIKNYFLDNNDLFEYGTSTPRNPYLTALNFIANTDLKPVDQGSDVCEIRYTFVPVYFEVADTDTPPYDISINSVKGGTLQRSCTTEYSATDTLTSATDYNFAVCHYRGLSPGAGSGSAADWDERVLNIWPNAAPATAPFRTVISGIYSLRFTCYTWNSSGAGALEALIPMSSAQRNPDNTTDPDPVYNLATGTPAPVAVRIDMKLLAPEDLKKLAFNIYMAASGPASGRAGARKQIRVLKQKMRTFSKVIYLGRREE